MNNISIQKMNESHIDEVYEISRNTFPYPWSKKELLKEVYKNTSLNLVLFLDNKLIGFIQTWFLESEADIINIAIDEKFRNHGLGKFLLSYLIKSFKEIGVKTIFLEVRVSNLAAEKLYKKIGFKVINVRDNYYLDGEDAYLMVLDIGNKKG